MWCAYLNLQVASRPKGTDCHISVDYCAEACQLIHTTLIINIHYIDIFKALGDVSQIPTCYLSKQD